MAQRICRHILTQTRHIFDANSAHIRRKLDTYLTQSGHTCSTRIAHTFCTIHPYILTQFERVFDRQESRTSYLWLSEVRRLLRLLLLRRNERRLGIVAAGCPPACISHLLFIHGFLSVFVYTCCMYGRKERLGLLRLLARE